MAQTNRLRQFFEAANRRRFFSKGEFIVMQGTDMRQAYMVAEGLVRVCDYDSKGNQRTIAIISKHHIFPFAWILDELPAVGAFYYYQAITKTTVYIANIDAVRELVRGNYEIAWTLLDAVGKSYYNAAARIQNLQKSNVEERVDFILYYLAATVGKIDSKNLASIEAPFTHKEIADLAGLTRESVSRQLEKSKYKKVFWKKKNKIYIDLAKLDTDSMPKVFSFGRPVADSKNMPLRFS